MPQVLSQFDDKGLPELAEGHQSLPREITDVLEV